MLIDREESAMNDITDPAALREHFGPVSALAEKKVLSKLDAHCRAFIALSPFAVLATCNAQGRMDASPRGDAPGFVAVLDDHTLLLPDRPGNRLIDSYSNVLANPGVGLIFFVPGINETVRVNGRARVVTGEDLLERVEAQGKVPKTGLLITVEEAFFHCAKALIRSQLWDPATRIERKSFPTLGQVIADQIAGVEAATADVSIDQSYRDRLY
jgi:PPOX class probable FMN-dependent enzyme